MSITFNDSAISNSKAPVWLYDNETLAILAVSGSACRMYGYSRDEFEALTLRDIVSPEDRNALDVQSNFLKTVWRHHTKQGRAMLVDVRDFSVEYGSRAATFSVLTDATERLKLENEGNELFKRYQLLSEAASDLIWDWDLRTDKISHNEALATLYGYDRSNLQESIMWWANVIHPDDYKTSAWSIQEAIREKRRYWSAEYRFRKADGSYIPVLDRGILQIDEDGNAVRMIGSIVDLSTRKAAEDERNQLFRLSLDSILIVDQEGAINLANGAFYNLVGLDSDENAVLNLIDFLSEEIGPHFRKALNATLTEDSVGRIVTPISAGRNVPRTVQWGMIANETKSRVFLIGRDITESQAAQLELQQALGRSQELAIEARAAHKAQSEFLQNMSHELRTPMNGLLGASQILAASAINEKQRKLASILVRSGESLLQILNDILDFSKAEANQIELDSAPLSLSEIAYSIYELFALPAQQKNLTLTIDVDPAADTRVDGDAFRLRQILSNLIGNAIKFTDDGEIGLSVALEAANPGRVVAVIRVCDDGIGVPIELQKRVFERFYQADSSLTRRHGGTGLGLSISKNLVELMGGSISLRSEPGKGSEFTIRIPFKLSDRVEKAVASTGLDAIIIRTALRVLVAEDVEVNAMIFTSWLDDRGFEYETATTGKLALEAVERCHFDGLFLDLHMPDLSGYEVIEAIRAREAREGGRLPIIAVTASVSHEERQKCASFGFDEYLPKPVMVADLDRVIAKFFSA